MATPLGIRQYFAIILWGSHGMHPFERAVMFEPAKQTLVRVGQSKPVQVVQLNLSLRLSNPQTESDTIQSILKPSPQSRSVPLLTGSEPTRVVSQSVLKQSPRLSRFNLPSTRSRLPLNLCLVLYENGDQPHPQRQNRVSVQIRTLDLHTICNISSHLKGQWRRSFEKIHGNLLQILEIEAQPKALEALVQYYDAPARCFTFSDFQMAPTLEEYERLLGLPLAEGALYFHQDQTPSWGTITRLLKTSEEDITKVKKNRNGIEGLPKAYLEQKLDLFRLGGDWPTFMDTLGLLIYGILLFPHPENYVDLAAMEVFLAKKNKGENPIMAVLADTYYSLHQCGERRRGILRCCTPLLYLWLTSHLFQCKHRTTCPIEDFKWSWVPPMTNKEWARKLDEATERSVRWYPPWNEREHIIVKCEGYPNVPLLGTQGAINYNPKLIVR
ncbi:hypothetical protein CR513_25290, partial [Mucuna pruriens]